MQLIIYQFIEYIINEFIQIQVKLKIYLKKS